MTYVDASDSAPAFVATQLDERVATHRATPITQRLVESSRQYITLSPEWCAFEETLSTTSR